MSSTRGFRLRLFSDVGMTRELRRSLYWVIWAVTAGMLGNVVTTGAVWSGFQREILGANDFQIGLFAAIPVAANVVQLFISYYMERKCNRRFLFLFFGLLGRSFWIPIGLVPYLFPTLNADLRIWMVIVFTVMVSGGNSFVNLGFGSLMGDLVPMRIRGQYFSVRQMISLISGVICGVLVSKMIDSLGASGYTIALVLAGVSYMLDITCFLFFKWPPMTRSDEPQKSFFTMLREVFANKPFMKVVIVYTLWLFASNIAGPFWNVYMIEDLRMSYTDMALYTQIISSVATVLFVSRWGRMIDRYGNKPVLQIAALACVFTPLPWLFATPSATFFVLLSNLFSGIFWPASDLCQQNLYLGESPQLHRSMYIAVFFAFVNLPGIALANAVGGWLMQNPFASLGAMRYTLLGITLKSSHYIFMLTMALRLLVVVFALPWVQEEGAWRATDALRDIIKRTRESFTARYQSIRTFILRKRLRKQLKQEEQHDKP